MDLRFSKVAGVAWLALLLLSDRIAAGAGPGGTSVAGTETIILFFVSFAISAAVAYFTRPDGTSATPGLDDTPNTVTTRGATVPLVFGRREVGPIVQWAGLEDAIPIVQKSGKGGGGSQTVGYNYREGASHLLCVGPGRSLNIIKEAGEVVWEGDITRDNTQNGDVFDLDDGSQFAVYFGTYDQAINPKLTGEIDYASRFPAIMRIDWFKKEKGQTRTWRDMRYDIIGIDCGGTTLGVPAIIGSGIDISINPAYIIWEVLTGIYPWGAGMSPSLIDKTSLEALAAVFEAEQVGANCIFGEETTVGSVLEALARDFGIAYRQSGGVLSFVALRDDGGAIPEFDNDRIKGFPRPRIDRGADALNLAIFTFKDIEHNFRDQPVQFSNNASAERSNQYTEQTDSLDTITTKSSADPMALRRANELFGVAQESGVTLLRDAEDVLPGDLIGVPGLGRVRATQTSHTPEAGEKFAQVLLQATARQLVVTPADSRATVNDRLLPSPDLRVAVLDASDVATVPAISVLRIRAHEQIVNTAVWVSGDGGAYSSVGQLNTPAGGGDTLSATALRTEWATGQSISLDDVRRPSAAYADNYGGLEFVAGGSGTTDATTEPVWPSVVGGTVDDNGITWTARALAEGFEFEPLSVDTVGLPNLAGDATAWENGDLFGYVNGEVIFPEQIEGIPETDWMASETVTIGTARQPLSVSTGYRIVATQGGTTAADEPDYPTKPGETVEDGTVIWEARYFRHKLVNVRRGRVGSDQVAQPADKTLFLIQRPNVPFFTDSRIASGAEVCVKTQPSASGRSVELGDVTAECVTLS